MAQCLGLLVNFFEHKMWEIAQFGLTPCLFNRRDSEVSRTTIHPGCLNISRSEFCQITVFKENDSVSVWSQGMWIACNV